MNYEKKYKEALERAKKILAFYKDPAYEEVYAYAKEDIPVIFPELAESEDERIREYLMDYVKSAGVGHSLFDSINTREKILLWLEKQDAQKQDWSEEDSEWYMVVKESILERWRGTDNKDLIEIRDGALEWLKSLKDRVLPQQKQGEQKETLCDKCRKEQPSHSCQDITELGRCAVEHEQKPINKVEPKFQVGENMPKLEKVEKVYDPTIPFLYTDFCTSKSYVEMDGYRINVIDLFNKLPKEE